MRVLNFLVLVSIFLSGCDTTISPFEEETGAFFSVYGGINLSETENSIRIRNLNTPFFADSSEGYEGITVSLSNITDGEAISLNRQTVSYSGNYAQNYLIQEALLPDTRYEFEIQTENGGSVNSDFITPQITQHSKSYQGAPVWALDDITAPVRNCEIKIRFIFTNVRYPDFIIPEAGFNYQGETWWGQVKSVRVPEYVASNDSMTMELTVTNLMVDVFPPDPAEATVGVPPEFWRPGVECLSLDDNEVYIRYTHFSADWEQFNGSDFYFLDILESDSVNNGLGFIGGLRTDEFSFTVSDLSD